MNARGLLLLATPLLLFLVSAAGAGEVHVETTAELRAAARNAQPGDRILLAPGEYEGGIRIPNLRGAAGRRIVIAAADPDRRPVIRGGRTGLHLVAPEDVELRDLIVRGAAGNGINIDDGGTADTPARNIHLERITVTDTGGEGNLDGVKLSGLDDFTVRRCRIERWGGRGSGIDMVGCHRGRIVETTLRHNGDTATHNGIQVKGGSSEIRIRNCRFENAGHRAINIGGSTGRPYFRPQPPPSYEASDITVEGCLFIGSGTAVAFVGVDGADVRYNTIYRPRRYILRILQETTAPGFVPSRNGRFARNLIIFRRDDLRRAVNIGPDTAPETFRFEQNWWYAIDRPDRSRPDLPTDELDGVYGRDPQLIDPASGKLRPAPDADAAAYGATALPSQ